MPLRGDKQVVRRELGVGAPRSAVSETVTETIGVDVLRMHFDVKSRARGRIQAKRGRRMNGRRRRRRLLDT
jgi:hypothetical protein